jgi:hypothetical protein
MASKPKTVKKTAPKTAPKTPVATAPSPVETLLSALFGGSSGQKDSETALFRFLTTALPGTEGQGQYLTNDSQSQFLPNTVGGVLSRLFGGAQPQAQMVQSTHDEQPVNVAAYQETPAQYYARLAQQAGVINGGFGVTNRPAGMIGAENAVNPATGKPVVKATPIAAKPAPKITANKITTQTATPTAAPAADAPAFQNPVSTGFQAADTFAQKPDATNTITGV